MLPSSTTDKPSNLRHPAPKSVALLDHHVPLQPHSAGGREPSGRRHISPVLTIAVIALLLGTAVAVFLEANTSPENELSAEKADSAPGIHDLVFTYSNSTYQTEWPIEWWIKNSFGVRNNGTSNLTVDFNATVLETGVEISPFPQPFHLYLGPGESQTIIYMLDLPWAGLTYDDLNVENNITRTLRFVFWTQGNTSDSVTIVLGHNIHVVPTTWIQANPNAVISGHVYGPTGKPMESVRVELLGSNIDYSTLTDQTGYYSIPFHAHQRLMTNETQLYGLVVRQPGYEAFMKAYRPQPGDSIIQDIRLVRASETVNLTLASRTETNMTIYRGAVSDDERYVMFAQGHCELNLTEDEIGNRSSVMLFDTWTGQMLWRHYTGGEVWGADLSDDGMYVAATVIQPAPVSYAVLLDRDGTEVWNTTSMGEMGSREIKISHDSKHIAWGLGNGSLYLLNLTDMKVLWTTFLEGQIRQIEFSSNDSLVYAGSGDGYLYAVNTTTGSIVWRANIEAWPYSTGGMTLSGDGAFIATASKMGNISLVDTSTHERLWSFDTMGGAHYTDISPNLDYVFAGSGGVYGTTLFDMNGTLRWFQRGSGSADIFPDGAHIALGQDWGLDIINPNGTVQWSYWEDFSHIGTPVTTSFVYVLKNQTKVIVGHGSGAAYFWNVTMSPVPGANDTSAPVTQDDYDGLWHPNDFTINLTATDNGTGVASTFYKVNDGPLMNVSADGQPLIHTEGADNKLEYWSVDVAGNEEWPHKVLTGIKLDVTDPVANASADQSVPYGSVVELNGTLSSDNFGIVNYTWTFQYDNMTKTLYGAVVTFQFDIPGVYLVTLRVTDASGRSSTDMVTITVENVPIPEFGNVLIPVIGLTLLAAAVRTRASKKAI